jgi:glycosyltransferase involved in cell wall biosynthesis
MYHGIKKTIDKIHEIFQFDIIHAHVALPDGYAAIKLATKYQIPVITTVHGADLYLTAEINSKCKQKVASVFSRSNKTVFVSKKLEQIAKEKTISNVESIVIGNGVSFEKQGTTKHRTTTTENKPPTIFSASYLITRKAIRYNLLALAEVLKKHNNVIYKIAGDGPEQENLRKLVNDLGIHKQVQFLGMLSHQETIEQMFAADIFSLPSWDEAFGVVYIEAMAEGKPVIACKGEGIEDVITHGKTGLLVKPKDVESLTDAFDFLLSNPDKAISIGERAKKLVLDNFTWEKNAEKTVKAYEEVLSTHMVYNRNMEEQN